MKLCDAPKHRTTALNYAYAARAIEGRRVKDAPLEHFGLRTTKASVGVDRCNRACWVVESDVDTSVPVKGLATLFAVPVNADWNFAAG